MKPTAKSHFARSMGFVCLLVILVMLSISSSSFVTAQTFAVNTVAAGNTGELEFSGISFDAASQIYVTTTQTPAKFLKFLTTPVFTRSTSVTLATGEDNCPAIAVRGSFAYIVCAPGLGSGKILRRHVNNALAVDLGAAGSIDRTPAHERTLSMVFTDANYIYAVSTDIDSGIVRINLDTFTYRDTLQLTGLNSTSAIITSSASHIWGATNTTPIELYKIDVLVFTRFSTEIQALSAGDDGVDIGLADDGTYLYVGTAIAVPARVIKVRMSDMSRISAVTLNVGENIISGMTVNTITGFGYLSLDSVFPAKVVQFELSTMLRTDSASGPSTSSNAARSLLLNQNIYVLADGTTGTTNPGRILRFTIATTTTTLGPTTSSTTTSSTTTSSTTSSTTTSSTTTSTTTTSTTTSTTTTPVPPPPPPGFGEADDSLAIDGSTSVAIAAGVGAGLGAAMLITLLLVAKGVCGGAGAGASQVGGGSGSSSIAIPGDSSPQLHFQEAINKKNNSVGQHREEGSVSAQDLTEDVFEDRQGADVGDNNGAEYDHDHGDDAAQGFERPQPRFDEGDDASYNHGIEMQ